MMINYRSNESHFRIKDRGVIRVFYLSQIDKISLLQQRDWTLNFILMGSAILCCSIGFLISEIFGSVRLFAYLVAALFFVFSLVQKAEKYKLIIVYNENRTIKIKVDIIELEDIRRQVSKINKAIRKEQNNYSFASNEMSEAPTLKRKTFDY